MSILEKLIETYLKLNEMYENDCFFSYEMVNDILDFLNQKKCCAFCEHYDSCESANKCECGVCASFVKKAEINTIGMHYYLKKHYQK